MFAEPSGRGRNDSPRQTAGMVGNSAKGDDEMTDDKGAGEVAYTATPDDKYINAIKAQAYAEGRKSMEKEFKELLDLANGMFDRIIEGRSCAKAVKDFDAWKKARGIE